jgi:hypothetical protein
MGKCTEQRRQVEGKWIRKVNILQKTVHIHVNATVMPVEATPGMGRWGDKEELWRK